MKHTFTINDLKTTGTYLVSSKHSEQERLDMDRGVPNVHNLMSQMYMIGWIKGHGYFKAPKNGMAPVLISLIDGCVMNGHYNTNGSGNYNDWKFVLWQTKEDLIDYLNNNEFRLPFRFATQNEIQQVARINKRK